jgi:hypothetical protein
MPKITPTLTITSKKYSSASDAGPTTSPIVISVTDSLDITEVRQKVVDVSDDHAILFASDTEGTGIISYTDATEVAGTDGGFIYLRNLTGEMAAASQVDIYIGVGTSAALEADATAIRLSTLKPGEFSFFAWDLTSDIIVDSNAAADTVIAGALEAYFFVRTTSI